MIISFQYSVFRGMKVTSGIVTINKDPKTNRIGITIGGGPPYCPCIYITQVHYYIIFSNKYRFFYVMHKMSIINSLYYVNDIIN